MKKQIWIGSLALVLLVVLFMVTNATKVSSLVLMLPFVLLFVGLSSLFAALLRWQGVSAAKSWRISAVVVAIPTIILILQSIGQLTVRDVLTIAILLAVLYFYVSRSSVASS